LVAWSFILEGRDHLVRFFREMIRKFHDLLRNNIPFWLMLLAIMWQIRGPSIILDCVWLLYKIYKNECNRPLGILVEELVEPIC
jgi:hypothetical protein